MAPNVAASARMNSHIPSFRDGMPYGDSSSRAPGRAPTVIAASPTAPPAVSARLHPNDQDHEQVQPQHVHEMPIQRRRPERGHRHGNDPTEATLYWHFIDRKSTRL